LIHMVMYGVGVGQEISTVPVGEILEAARMGWVNSGTLFQNQYQCVFYIVMKHCLYLVPKSL
jgi:hypothetical protein